MTYISASPAYGRDYKSQKAVKEDWEVGKDFIHESSMFTGGGTYLNKNDVSSGDTVNIRYAKLTKVCVIKVK